MMAETTEPTSLPPGRHTRVPRPTPDRPAPRAAAIALVELIDGMSNAPVLPGDMSEVPDPGIGGAIIKMPLAAHPVLALSALMFAAIGYVRHPILALVILMTWLNYMPSVVLHGFDSQAPLRWCRRRRRSSCFR
jgi:hypothetical protein